MLPSASRSLRAFFTGIDRQTQWLYVDMDGEHRLSQLGHGDKRLPLGAPVRVGRDFGRRGSRWPSLARVARRMRVELRDLRDRPNKALPRFGCRYQLQ